ncbi:neutral amino acid transporter 9-like [Phymastichus coffea]|uniref:neutral amino acid transporter 9-like n=1 Tax=Phymastichus coffea TaxID=108790 RepID=UPI00273CF2A3|nr:neutral amino acid transporter 9-like [Phymastichus coffea]
MDEQRNKRVRCWSATASQRDSGSECVPLLSSGCSRAVGEPDSRSPTRSDFARRPSCAVVGHYSAISATASPSPAREALPGAHLPARLEHAAQQRCQVREAQLALSRFLLAERSGRSAARTNVPGQLLEAEAARTAKACLLDGFFGDSLPALPSIIAEDVKPKQSSLVTIFSVWNTILGSSMLTMPWGIHMAGFLPAIALILAMSGLCLFTAYKLLQIHKYHGGGERIEVMELSKYFLGSWAEHLANVFSISVLLGASVAYWILMSNFLYNSVNFLYDTFAHAPVAALPYNESRAELLCPREEAANGTINLDNSYDSLGPAWDLYRTVPIFLGFLVFPILNFNTTTFFTKFNSLGTVSIVYLLAFVVVKSSSWGLNMNKASWTDSWVLRSTFPALTGMLSLSFFIHNIIITIMQSNRDQRKNGRDLTIAYVLVTSTYIVVGIVFYVCFPLAKRCIEDNLLNNFQKSDGLTVGARVLLLFQLFTVYPLIAFMLRKQLLASFVKSRECRQSAVLLVNLLIVAICVLFALFLPHVGTIVRYTGAISGLVYVFMLPSLLHLVVSRRQGTITVHQVFWHTCVPVVGIVNLVSQFFVRAH